jgi:HPt (histidine-containing phosphotransfer) domain-containing protein
MNDYIAKPFSEADLLRKMDYWLQQAGIGQSVPGPVVDLQFLQQQTRGNRTFIREMVGMFKTHSPGEVQALREAVASVDFDAVYKLAHRLRNSVGLFGLNATVGSWLQQIEQLARGRKGIDEIGLLLQKVESVIGQAIEELSTPDLVL